MPEDNASILPTANSVKIFRNERERERDEAKKNKQKVFDHCQKRRRGSRPSPSFFFPFFSRGSGSWTIPPRPGV